MADNYRVNIINDKKEIFDATIDLIFLSEPKHRRGAYSYKIVDGCLVLASGYENKNGKFKPDQGSTEFPFHFSVALIKKFAWGWLSMQEYPQEPDQDGSNEKGFWINTSHGTDEYEMNIWHGAANVSLGIFLVKPVWTMYGK